MNIIAESHFSRRLIDQRLYPNSPEASYIISKPFIEFDRREVLLPACISCLVDYEVNVFCK